MNRTIFGRAGVRRASVLALAAALLSGSTTTAHAAVAPDPALLPFNATSPWRLGIAKSATFAPSTDVRNSEIADVDGPGQAWVNSGRYSHPIAWATSSTPWVSVTDSKHSLNGVPAGGTWQEQIPSTARIADGMDKHMHVITADRKYVQEHWAATRVSSTQYTTSRRHQVSLTGSGIGPQNGTRAYGGSAIGGLIRAWEVDPTHPSYTGTIDHALAVALRASQLYYSGVTKPQDGYGATYDRYGYGLAQGYVWPATEQDSDSQWSYSGKVPMGSYFAIPGSVNIDSLGLETPQARMIAKAAQDYGVYVTDRSGASTFYVEDDGGRATEAFTDALVGEYLTAPDVRKVFKALRVVTSNSATTPNGGPLTAERRGRPVTGTTTTQPAPATTVTQPAPAPTTTAPAPVATLPAAPAPTPTTAPAGQFSARVRFADAASTPPSGYAADWGQPYGARTGTKQGVGLTYGWVKPGTTTPIDLTKNGRVRTGTPTTDPRQTGVMHMDWRTTSDTMTAAPGAWEMAVPNGSYTVTVSAGDPGVFYDSTHKLAIEGVSAVSYTPTATSRHRVATKTVTVTDGRLTLSPTGGTNTKINYVDVSPAPKPAVTRMVLVDAGRDNDIRQLTNGSTISLAALGTTKLNIRAETTGAIKSVVFGYDSTSRFRLENTAPWAMAGDDGGDYHAWTPTVGTHTVKVTPYPGEDATGTAGAALSVTFTVTK